MDLYIAFTASYISGPSITKSAANNAQPTGPNTPFTGIPANLIANFFASFGPTALLTFLRNRAVNPLPEPVIAFSVILRAIKLYYQDLKNGNMNIHFETIGKQYDNK